MDIRRHSSTLEPSDSVRPSPAANPAAIDPWIEVAGERLAEVCRFLRDEPDLRFNMLHCITGVDYFQPDAKKAAAVDWQPHVEVLYHLSSLVHRHRLVLKVIAAALEGRRRGPAAGSAQREPRLEHGRLARARGVRPVRRVASSAIPTCGGSCCPRTGWAIRCGRITSRPPSTTGFQGDSTMSMERVDPELVEFDLRSDEMLVNMGPQHPSTHGVLRLVLRTDGEVVTEVTPHIGYLHRCAEKIGENLTPRQFIPYTDRLDYLAGDEHEPRLGAGGGEAAGLRGCRRRRGTCG